MAAPLSARRAASQLQATPPAVAAALPTSVPPATQPVATPPGATSRVAASRVATEPVATQSLKAQSQWLEAEKDPGGFRLLKKPRTAAWRTLAITVVALAFPATALGAGSSPAQPATSASARASAAPSPVAHARLGRSVLALGSGYMSHGGSPLVRIVQRDLDAAGYPPGHMDGLYGPRTRQAVVTFQAAHGLPVDGVVGPRTWAALSVPVLTLGPGAGDQPGGERGVRSLQRRLVSGGISPGPIDGRYGVLTEAAVRRFQRTHRLPVTGIAGPRTLALLTAARPSLRRSNPLPQKPAPSATRSNRSSRPSGSTVARAPRQRPATAVRNVPRGSAHRPRSGSVPWMIVLGGLALVLALVLVARLLIASLRRAPSRSEGRSAVAEQPVRDATSAPLDQPGLTTMNGDHEAVARTNGNQPHTNGRRAKASADGNGNGANRPPSGGQADDFPWTDETAGAFHLDLLLAGQGGVDEAQAADDRADQRGQGTAASDLGRLLEEQGALAEAEAAYRRADELGDSAGAFHLGLVLEGQRGVVEAQAAYGRADQRGHGTAASHLGRLLEEQGALAEAEAAYRRADERGDAEGAFRLGALLRARGAADEAAAAYGRAGDRGHNGAALDLGVLLVERGAPAAAETAFGCADERGDALAAFNLGVLLEQRGALAEARAAYRRAEQRDDGEAADMARAALRDLGQKAAETRAGRARQAQRV
jgi:peptidoglycan hydrolase-like protein with peptidoglycan-binding domain/tetratricopeptide (TPR) repeat protein